MGSYDLPAPIAMYRALDDVLVWPDTDGGWDHLDRFVQLPADRRVALTETLSLEYSLIGAELNQANVGTLAVLHIEELDIQGVDLPAHMLVALDPRLQHWVEVQRLLRLLGMDPDDET